MQEGGSESGNVQRSGQVVEEQASFRPLKRGRMEQQASESLDRDWRPAQAERHRSSESPKQHDQVGFSVVYSWTRHSYLIINVHSLWPKTTILTSHINLSPTFQPAALDCFFDISSISLCCASGLQASLIIAR